MCGICGIVSFQPKGRNLVDTIQHLNQKISHRGPDGEGYLTSTLTQTAAFKGKKSKHLSLNPIQQASPDNLKLALGHQRLSIIDLTDRAHQPLSYLNEKYWIVYNGEVYNHPELRSFLKQKGYQFQTSSDTEVILAAYDHYGPNCVSHFFGMFSFVIYDREQQVLFGARDRFGVKPFYYIHEAGEFIFSSEIKGLTGIDGINYQLDEGLAFDWLVFNQQEHTDASMIQPIKELMPGYSFELNLHDGALNTNKYYQIPKPETSSMSMSDLQNQLRSLIEKNIQQHIVSDVPIGTCLSGGIDSSIISALMRQFLPDQDIASFTASFPGYAIDEADYARQIIQKYHLTDHWVYPNDEGLINDFDEFITALDLPLWSTSTFAQWELMKKAKEEKIKVLLNGQGADELFAGYKHHHYYVNQSASGKSYTFQDRLKELAKQKLYHELPSGLLKSFKKAIHQEFTWLNEDFIERNWKNRLALFRTTQEANTLLERIQSDFQNAALKTFLRCEDRTSMHFGIESRVPFATDHHLLEFILSLPQSAFIQQGEQKHLLKQTFKNLLPPAIFNRQNKIGLETPNNIWIGNQSEFLKRLPFDNQIFNSQAINSALSNPDDLLAKPENGRTFKYLIFSQWSNLAL